MTSDKMLQCYRHKVPGKVIGENVKLCLRKIWADLTEEVTFEAGLKG